MRVAAKLLLGSLAALLATTILLRIFFSDVKPIAWSEPIRSGIRLEVAFFLLTIENIAIVCVAIASIAMFMLLARSCRAASSK